MSYYFMDPVKVNGFRGPFFSGRTFSGTPHTQRIKNEPPPHTPRIKNNDPHTRYYRHPHPTKSFINYHTHITNKQTLILLVVIPLPGILLAPVPNTVTHPQHPHQLNSAMHPHLQLQPCKVSHSTSLYIKFT